MNPNKGEAAQQFESSQLPVEGFGNVQEKAQESVRTQESTPGTQPPPPAITPLPIPAMPAPTIPGSQDDAQSVSTVTAPVIRDSDHIERQWIDRAKAIVAQTQSDPYKQKHEMSKVKADYIQKRFNKTVKIDADT